MSDPTTDTEQRTDAPKPVETVRAVYTGTDPYHAGRIVGFGDEITVDRTTFDRLHALGLAQPVEHPATDAVEPPATDMATAAEPPAKTARTTTRKENR